MMAHWQGWVIALGLLLISSCGRSLINPPQIPAGGLNSQSADEYPAYSGDGRYLALASDRSGQRNIYLFDLQERRLVTLPNLNRLDSSQDQPSLSQDGRFIAYTSNERGRNDVFVYDRQAQRSWLLSANIQGAALYPAISGDGSQVAFQTNQQGLWQIAIVDNPHR